MRRRSLVLGTTAAIGAAGTGLLAGILTRKSANDIDPAATRTQVAQLLDSRMSSITGEPTDFRQWRGKTLVANYWATWCPPCREEMPGFSRLAERLSMKNVQFVGIAADSADNVREFSAKTPVAYPLVLASPEAIEIAKNLGNPRLALPFTLIIAPDGTLRERRLGAMNEQELAALLRY